MDLAHKRIMISKTNQIGDVTFALPIASALKKYEPTCTILFIGRGYTRALIEQYADVDEFVDWEYIKLLPEKEAVEALKALQVDIIIHVQPNKELAVLAKQAGIPKRIGTGRRLFHWTTCNQWVNVMRKNSPLHETQMDMHYLKAFGIKSDYSYAEINALRHYTFKKTAHDLLALLDSTRFNLILHPKTRGQHIEWPPTRFAALIKRLPEERFKIFVTGSEEEGKEVRAAMVEPFPHVVDLTGKTTLNTLMEFIAAADGLIAASTGPVHLAANYGINTLGVYAPIKPFDAGRWGPVGPHATVLSMTKDCSDCRYAGPCHCIAEITEEAVYNVISQWQRIPAARQSISV